MFRATSHLALNCAGLKCADQKGTFPVAGDVSDLLSLGSAKSLMFHLPFPLIHKILVAFLSLCSSSHFYLGTLRYPNSARVQSNLSPALNCARLKCVLQSERDFPRPQGCIRPFKSWLNTVSYVSPAIFYTSLNPRRY